MNSIYGRFLCHVLIFASIELLAFTPEWKDVILDKNAKNRAYWLKSKDKKKFYGGIIAKRGADFEKIKVSIKDNRIVVDVRDALKPGSFVDIGYKLPLKKINNSVPTEFTIDISGKEGASGAIGLDGHYKNKKHYWNNKAFILTGGNEIKKYERQLPENLKGCMLIVRMKKPAIYSFGQASFSSRKETAYDPTQNLIVNGGAEHGWYSTGVNNIQNKTNSKEYNTWNGYVYSKALSSEIDTTEKSSGNASFKFTVPEEKGKYSAESHYIMHFNQVPYIIGKPALFTFRMKSDRPKAKVMVRLHTSPGGAFYGLWVSPGKEWKTYKIQIPKFGKKPKHGWVSNKFRNDLYKLVVPRIEFRSPGTFWIDDAAYFLADKGEFTNDNVSVTGRLNKDCSYYFSNEKIQTRLSIVSMDKNRKTLPLSWKLYDFFGRKVAESPEKEIRLENGRANELLKLLPPANLRGALNWEINISGTIHNYYLGIIDPPKAMSARLGVNIGGLNAKIATAYLKDFRYSSVRIWEKSGKRDNLSMIHPFHKKGFYTLVCLNKIAEKHKYRYLFLKDLSPWQDKLKKLAEKYKGMVDAYEIINEPNALAGRGKNPDPSKYIHITPQSNADVIKAAAEALHSVDPKVKIAGPTTCHTDVSWISNVLACGAWKYLDIITEHPYHTQPELPDYTAMIKSILQDSARYGKTFPLYATEYGCMMPTLPAHNRHNQKNRESSAKIIRTMLLCYAAGGEKFFDFAFGTGSYATSYTMVRSGNPGNNYMPLPGYNMYASRAMADRIENAPMVKKFNLGILYSCYIFDHGKKRTAVLWKWSGKPETIHFDRPFDIYDFMGTRSRKNSVELSKFPVYLETGISTEKLVQIMAKADLKADGGRFRLSTELNNAHSFSLIIKNLTGKTIPAGTVNVLQGEIEPKTASYLEIGPEASALVSFRSKKEIGLTPVPARIKVADKEFNLSVRGTMVSHAPTNFDSTEKSAWKSIPKLTLSAGNDSVRYGKWSKKELDIKADVQMAWNVTGLYFAVTVYKDSFYPPAEGTAASATWQADGLQIAFDTLKNSAPGDIGYKDDDFEYDIAMYRGKPMVYRRLASLAIHDSLTKACGVIDDVKCAIRQEPGKIIYLLAFSPSSVSPFHLKAGESMRASVLVNLNNGKKRIGYLQLSPGLGSSKKKPGKFIELFLAK